MDLLISSATHRSGSTMLQRIFNARKETLIWGENGGCLTDFNTIFKNTMYYSRHSANVRNEYFKGNEDPNNWIATLTPPLSDVRDAITQSIKQFHESLYSDKFKDSHDIIGYKEVRYGKEELELIRLCYPNCIVLLLIRDPINVWKSISNKAKVERYGSVENFSALWNRRVMEYVGLSIKDSNMHLIKYEDIVLKKENTLEKIKDIGQLNDDQIELVMSEKISSSSRPIAEEIENAIRKNCYRTMKRVGYIGE